jgi:hypothetical protein
MNLIPKLPLLAALPIFSAMLSPCLADTYSTNAISDAFVATGPTGNLSGDNFGAAGSLTVEAADLPQGQFQSVIEFDLSGAENHFNSEYGAGGWTVQSVSLELTASSHGNAIFNATAAGQFAVSLMVNNSWVEGTGTGGAPTTDGISFNSLQNTYINNAVDQGLGVFQFTGGSSGTGIYNLGLTSGLTGDLAGGDDLSLRLSPNDNNVSYLFNSRMASPGQPELVITAVPEPGTLGLGVLALGLLSIGRCKRAGAWSAPGPRINAMRL